MKIHRAKRSLGPQSMLWGVEESAMAAMMAEWGNVKAEHGDGDAFEDLGVQVQNGVAVIPMAGLMVKDRSPFAMYFGCCPTQLVAEAVIDAANDPTISSILLVADSPGGSVDGLPALADTVADAATRKTIHTQVSGTCASAAYYVAAQTHKIFVGRMDMVGSIGCVVVLYDESEAFKQAGVEPVVISTGEFKTGIARGVAITDERKAEIQKIVDAYGDDFVMAVAKGRNLSPNVVRASADGRMFLPDEAMERGLIDGVQSIQETFAALASVSNEGRRNQIVARLHIAGADVV